VNIRPILFALVGVAAGIALVVSCGHGPSGADAADACNCPAAEPPLTGRVVRVSTTDNLPGNTDYANLRASCPSADSVVLGGSCRLAATSSSVVLRESGIDDQTGADGWLCAFGNSSATLVSVTATVICLNPAQ
jgi:hypothetical protein